MKQCPCIECVCLAVCRHKDYYDLFQQCYTLREIEPCYNLPMSRDGVFIKLLAGIIKPTNWYYKESNLINHIAKRRVYDNKNVSM